METSSIKFGNSSLHLLRIDMDDTGIRLSGDESDTWMRGRQGGRMTRYGITAHIVVNPSNYREMNSGFVDVGLSKKISKKYCIDDSGVIFERNK